MLTPACIQPPLLPPRQRSPRSSCSGLRGEVTHQTTAARYIVRRSDIKERQTRMRVEPNLPVTSANNLHANSSHLNVNAKYMYVVGVWGGVGIGTSGRCPLFPPFRFPSTFGARSSFRRTNPWCRRLSRLSCVEHFVERRDVCVDSLIPSCTVILVFEHSLPQLPVDRRHMKIRHEQQLPQLGVRVDKTNNKPPWGVLAGMYYIL